MVIKNNSFKEILDKLKSCENVLMTLHRGPDGDSLGSCTAMKYFLDKKGINSKIIGPDEVADNLKDFKFVNEVEFGVDISEVDLSKYDVLLVLDCASWEMASRIKEIRPDIFVINIDHHRTNDYYGDLNYVDFDSASTCSVLINFFEKIDREIADRLLLGVCTDSGFFTYSTAPNALEDASLLINNGGDYMNILRNVLYNEPLRMYKYYNLILSNLHSENHFGYSEIRSEEVKDLNLNESELRLGINQIHYIKEFDFVFTLIETDDGVKGSFRSRKGVDVSKFAKALGGGGHKSAAGFSIDLPFDKAKKKVLDIVRKLSKC